MKEKPEFNLDTNIQYEDDAIGAKKPDKKIKDKVGWFKGIFIVILPERLRQILDRFIAFLILEIFIFNQTVNCICEINIFL